jgi:hypothetical protein
MAMRRLHLEARKRAKSPWAVIDPGFFRILKKTDRYENDRKDSIL